MTYFIYDPIYTQHLTGLGHPECPQRVIAIHTALEDAHLIKPSLQLAAQPAQEDNLLLVHTPCYLELVGRELTSVIDAEKIHQLSTGDVTFSAKSYDAAIYAAGSGLSAVDRVMNSPNFPVFCICRPPGHHACSNKGMGFCLFNNVAITARYAQKKYGIERILIADWDVHHGNGTQEIFYNDPTVFYFSTHEKGLYPFTGAAEERGAAEGIGFTCNCPIAASPTSRLEVLEAFKNRLIPLMDSFQPELILVSCGFDAHFADPLGHFNLTDQDFFELTHIVKEIANKYSYGRLISLLEGGYDLAALASASVAHVQALGDMGYT